MSEHVFWDRRRMDRRRHWRSRLAILAGGALAALTLTGIIIWLAPFSIPTQVTVLVHTALGVALLLPCCWYLVRHWLDYWRKPWSHLLVLGYLSAAAVLICLLSGVVLTWQALFGIRISYLWDAVHIVATLALIALALPHILLVVARDRKVARTAGDAEALKPAAAYTRRVAILTAASLLLIAAGWMAYRPPELQRRLPQDYSFVYGPDRPFAPSLARTPDNRAVDPRLLSGSLSCGTSGCHEQIVREWVPSAHRYAAMDPGFQKIQMNMAELNGPESTRYCGGCHDPISLFSGAKNLFTDTEKLTSLHGYREGVSCLVCHAVRSVDVKGNANYLIHEPSRYMFEIEYDERPTAARRIVRDFLIRAYPWQHVEDLGKRLFKAPEYCAACHKQFVDQEINNFGWVQLQNQYDNWRQSRWNHPGDPSRTIECRECHMPLVASTDPAAGDAADYNRTPDDGKHRSHRFLAANQMMPRLLELPGWQEHVELTEQWLRGEYEVPEIAHKWQNGPVVGLELDAPDRVRPGDHVNLRLIITSNKVGHDFPTGPLDIIQAWIQLLVSDEAGNTIFSRGSVDRRGFIEPGAFMFKAEPVDKHGNLIDRHNLWEMVGVRYRRSLFPGFSDTAEFNFLCPETWPARPRRFPQEVSYQIRAPRPGHLNVEVRLCYRKIDQYLMNFIFGEDKGLTAPVTVMATAAKRIAVEPHAR